MFETNKINSTIKPEKFESLNNGIWYYNFDITSEIVTNSVMEEGSEEITRYNYGQVRVSGKPTINKCYEAVLKSYLNEDGTSLWSIVNSPAKTDDAVQLAESLYELVEIDFGVREKPTELEVAKKKVIKAIEDYDVSMEVNSFFLNGLQVWLDKSTRVGLQNSITIEKEAGREETTLWFNGIKIVVGCTLALQMLSILELYALGCYNKTAEHKNNVQKLTSVEDVMAYDYTEGYPDKPEFNI